jgi:hypothetical protein
MGKKKTFFIKNRNPNIFNFSFPFVSNFKQIPPLAQSNGWGNTPPWHMQHNERRATM